MKLMSYQEFGDQSKPKLIILHGFLGSKNNWASIAKNISHVYHVFTLDIRNHGASFHDEVHSYDALVEDLKCFIETFKIESPTIMGHSMGGKIAMKFACRFPLMLQKLIVVDIAPKKYSFNLNEIEGMLSINLNEINSKKDGEDILKKYVSDLGMRKFLMTNLVKSEQKGFYWRVNLNVLNFSMELIGENPLAQTDQYTGETIFIMGQESKYYMNVTEDIFKYYFSNAMIKTIKGAEHIPHFTHPQEFTNLILSI